MEERRSRRSPVETQSSGPAPDDLTPATGGVGGARVAVFYVDISDVGRSLEGVWGGSRGPL